MPKPLQNKKDQKNLRYPTKKHGKEDCFLLGTSNFYGPSYFETALPKLRTNRADKTWTFI